MNIPKIFIITLLTITVGTTSYPLIYAAEEELVDGTYEGKYSFVTVEVTVKEAKISNIEILQHGGGGKEYADMVEPLIDKIIQKQSTTVDSVTGATVSSQNLRKAVDNALQKACQSNTTLKDF